MTAIILMMGLISYYLVGIRDALRQIADKIAADKPASGVGKDGLK